MSLLWIEHRQYLLPPTRSAVKVVVEYLLLVHIYKSSRPPDTAQSGNTCSELQSGAPPKCSSVKRHYVI